MIIIKFRGETVFVFFFFGSVTGLKEEEANVMLVCSYQFCELWTQPRWMPGVVVLFIYDGNKFFAFTFYLGLGCVVVM
ncbi:hypothetical protein L6452_34074 [Arctium lappa]|uniref:Uncharacterized protein n=1 Tax=Arctium lappa TaxID=4217 RepID=A0ACB8YGK5_ARCLA|nr:hypothetical protein L6452_34074 [Arctium lappa]